MYHSQENLNRQQQPHSMQSNSANFKKHPVSILKRFDSSEKMYPISRPASNLANPGSQTTLFMNQNEVAVNSNHNNPYAFQMNIPGGNCNGGTFPRNKQQLVNLQQQQSYCIEQPNDFNANANIYDPSQKGRNPNTPNIQQIRQKRVQFANIPPSPANQNGKYI